LHHFSPPSVCSSITSTTSPLARRTCAALC
jgi:hypothetical protein